MVMFCDSNYATNTKTRNNGSGLFTKLGVTLLTSSSKTQRTIKLISMKAEYVALLECAQEVKFVRMSLKEMTEVQKPVVVCKDNQGAIF